jgi:spermidine synthase
MAGLASLFTREFFLLAKNRLRQDGVFVQFFHSYQMNWPTFALITRTFSGVFPHSLLVSPYEGDYLLIGFKKDNRLSLAHAADSIRYAQQSKNVTVTDPRLLYRLIVTEDLDRLSGPGRVHTDNRPHLEFSAPKLLFTVDPAIETNIRSRRRLTQETRSILRNQETVEAQIAFATFALSVHKPFHKMVDLSRATIEEKKRFSEIMEEYCSHSLIEDFSIFTDQGVKERCLRNQRDALQSHLHLSPDKSAAYSQLGDLHREGGELSSAIVSYQKALELDPDNAEAHNNMGVIYRKQGRVDQAIAQFRKAATINPDHAQAHYNLGNAFDRKARLDDAISAYKKAIGINPRYVKAHNNLGMAYHKKGMLEDAIAAYKNALALDPDLGEAHNNLFIAYYYTGNFRLAVVHCDKAIALGVPVKPKYLELIEPYR